MYQIAPYYNAGSGPAKGGPAIPEFSKEKVRHSFVPFYYKDSLIDEQTERDTLLQVAKELGMAGRNSLSNLSLCKNITKILKLQHKFYDSDFVLSIGGQPFEDPNSSKDLDANHFLSDSQSEPESAPEGPTTKGNGGEFTFPTSIVGVRGKYDERKKQEDVKVWNSYIQGLKSTFIQAPETQIAGKYDPTHAKPLGLDPQSIENILWDDCDDLNAEDDFWDNVEERDRRHPILQVRRATRYPGTSRFTNLDEESKWRSLIKLMARSSKQDVVELKELLRTIPTEPMDLNRIIVDKDKVSIPNVKCENYVGKNLIQIALLCANFFQEGVDPYLTIRELLCSSVSLGLPMIDLNAISTDGDTALMTAMRRCQSIKREIRAIREATNSPDTPAEYKISEDLLRSRAMRAYLILHDIIFLLLRPGDDCGRALYSELSGEDEFGPINVNKDNKGETPISIAAKTGCLRCVRFLQHHANLDVSIREHLTGRSALMEAVRRDNPLMVLLMLQEKKNLRQRDKDWQTVFHAVARNGFDTGYKRHPAQKDIVAQKWKDMHKDKQTGAEHYMTYEGEAPQIMEMLWFALKDSIEAMKLKTSAEIEIAEKISEIKVPKSQGQEAPSKEFVERSTRMDREFYRVVQKLIDAQDGNKLTALMIAVLKRDYKMVKFILAVCNGDPLVIQPLIQATALQMLEFDLRPEIFPEMKKARYQIETLLRAAEESALRKSKAARLMTYGPIPTPYTLTEKNLPPEQTEIKKALEKIPSLQSLSKELSNLYELFNKSLDASSSDAKQAIVVKYVRQYFTPHVCVLGIISKDERQFFVAQRYQTAVQLGLQEFEKKLYDLEEYIRKRFPEGSEDLHNVSLDLCDFIRTKILDVIVEKAGLTKDKRLL